MHSRRQFGTPARPEAGIALNAPAGQQADSSSSRSERMIAQARRVLCAILLSAFAATPQLPAQLIPADPYGQNVYAKAKPYINGSLRELIKKVPELRGLEPPTAPVDLPEILSNAGHQLVVYERKVPDLIAREDVWQERRPLQGFLPQTLHHTYTYLISPEPEDGQLTLLEHRAPWNGESAAPSGAAAGFALTTGFATLWSYFYPSNTEDSTFRCLGTQQVDGLKTYVIGFAQKPSSFAESATAELAGKTIVVLYQGVGWIDASTFRIVRVRTDLLAPRPDVHLDKLTSEVSFGSVSIPQVSSPLWLPLKAVVTADYGGMVFQNTHRYSDYRLFTSGHRFMSPPPRTAPPNPKAPARP